MSGDPTSKRAGGRQLLESISSRQHCSLCYRVENAGTSESETRFYRIADVIKENGEYRLIDARIEKKVLNKPREYPNYLRNRTLEHSSLPDNLSYLAWTMQEDNRILSKCESEFPSLKTLKAPIMVYEIGRDVKADDLPDILREGIQVSVCPMERFLLVYRVDRRELQALDCMGRNFEFQAGILRLKVNQNIDLSNSMQLPVAMIKPSQYMTVKNQRVPHMTICTTWDVEDLDWKMPVLGLRDLAPRYVIWANKQLDSPLSRTDRQRLRKFIDDAFERPVLFDEFLRNVDSHLYDAKVSELRRSVAQMAMDNGDGITRFVREALEEDSGFKELCEKRVREEYVPRIAEAERSLEQRRETLCQLGKKISDSKDELADIESSISSRSSELAELNAQVRKAQADADTAVNEILSNVAIRLGLRSVASMQVSSQVEVEGPRLIETKLCENSKLSDADLERCLTRNLSALGVRSRSLATQDIARYVMAAFVTATQTGSALAIDLAFSHEIADALSYSLLGTPAHVIEMPFRCDDSTAILRLVDGQNNVIVLINNVIDSGNEAIMTSELGRRSSAVIIYSVSTCKDLRLIAPEVWGQCLYLGFSDLYISYSSRKKLKVLPNGVKPDFPVDDDDLKDGMDDIEKVVGRDSIPMQNLALVSLLKSNLNQVGIRPDNWQFVVPQLVLSLTDDRARGERVSTIDKETHSIDASRFATRVNYEL